MKKFSKKFLIRIVTCILMIFSCTSFCISTSPVFADQDEKNCACANGKDGYRPPTKILGQGSDDTLGCECGNGESVRSILGFVVNILTVGVGILGVVGISITGVQYLTAGGNEEQVKKAKRRLFEIIIGLAAYAVIFGFMKWLIPDF